MELDKINICRLCLEICHDNFENIKEIHKINLNLILLNLNLVISYIPIICTKCGETLQKCSDFKMACLLMENSVALFVEKQDNVEVNLQRFYRKTLPEGCNVCRFCLKITRPGFFIFFDDQLLDILLMNALLQQYFPEMDLHATKEPVICMQCYKFLQHYFNFVINCLTVENKINRYRDAEGSKFKGMVKLSEVVYFTIHGVFENKDECSGVDVIETQGSSCEKGGEEDDSCNKFEVKDEIITEEGERYPEQVGNNCVDTEEKFEIIVKDESPKETECIYVERNIKSENITDCEGLDYADIKNYIEHGNNQTNGQKFNANSITIEKMEDASFQADALSLHLEEESEQISSEKRFKCDLCPYQTKRKKDLKDHLLIHKSRSEVPVYKCDLCDYQTKRKYSVKRHKLNHKSISEVTMHKCEICPYQTKCKSNLQQHLLNHNKLEQAIYKCETCEYRSNYKTNIHKHMLIHKTTAEVAMFKCTLCPYQTKHNCNLQLHILTHKNNSEVSMYKCQNCEFQTKYKNNLRVHVQVHKSINELTMYKCEMCEYQAKRRSDVRRHMLTHKSTTPLTT